MLEICSKVDKVREAKITAHVRRNRSELRSEFSFFQFVVDY